MPDDREQPWRLVRRGHPPLRFPTREAAQRFYDRLRFNAGADAAATLYGPDGERWRCGRYRRDQWVCEEPAGAGPPPQTAEPWWMDR